MTCHESEDKWLDIDLWLISIYTYIYKIAIRLSSTLSRSVCLRFLSFLSFSLSFILSISFAFILFSLSAFFSVFYLSFFLCFSLLYYASFFLPLKFVNNEKKILTLKNLHFIFVCPCDHLDRVPSETEPKLAKRMLTVNEQHSLFKNA